MSYSALDSLDMGTRVLETKDCIKGWGGRWKLEGPFCPALMFRPFPGAMASLRHLSPGCSTSHLFSFLPF